MSYSQKCKRVKLDKLGSMVLHSNELRKLCAQYNPDRFISYEKCTSNQFSKKSNPLHMNNSPHIRLLCDHVSGSYYRMHHLYGRKHQWIINKIDKFKNLYGDILQNGMQENPIILETPLAKNEYNKSYEIWEGHHRIACCIALNIVCTVDVYGWSL